jgi:rhamnosyltransferase
MLRVVVPTLNAAKHWPAFAPALLACVRPDQVLILDSASTDGTPELTKRDGFQLSSIARADFDHGGTRQMAAEMLPEAQILIYLTQDVVLDGPEAIGTLLLAFRDPQVGAAYGRQLARPQAGPIEAHARAFNYPAVSAVRTIENRKQMGIKTIFFSNSFGAYRRAALMEVGGFPSKIVFGEDTVVAGRLLLAGHKIAYVAEARGFHSHPHSILQEFRRYFDIGSMHSRESWLLDEFGQAAGEGKRFVLSELRYLLRRGPWLIPSALLRTAAKLLGYRLGRAHSTLFSQTGGRLGICSSFNTGLFNKRRSNNRPHRAV